MRVGGGVFAAAVVAVLSRGFAGARVVAGRVSAVTAFAAAGGEAVLLVADHGDGDDDEDLSFVCMVCFQGRGLQLIDLFMSQSVGSDTSTALLWKGKNWVSGGCLRICTCYMLDPPNWLRCVKFEVADGEKVINTVEDLDDIDLGSCRWVGGVRCGP